MFGGEIENINLCLNETDSSFLEIANHVNPLSPKIDFYLDLFICATFWQVITNSCYYQKYFKKFIIYDNISPCPFKRTLGLRGYVFFFKNTATVISITVKCWYQI